MSTKNIVAMISIFAVIIMMCMAFILYTQYNNDNRNALRSYALGDMSEYGYVGVEVSYDATAPDVFLISPSNYIYSKSTADGYNINEEKKVITMLVDSDELGLWAVSFAKLDNEKISYQFINKMSSTVYIADTNIICVDNEYFVEVRPVLSADESVKCNYSLSIQTLKSKYDLEIPDTMSPTIPINESTYIPIIIPDSIKDAGEAKLKVTIKTTETNTRMASKEIPIILSEKLLTMDQINTAE